MIPKQQRDDARQAFFAEALRYLEFLRDTPLDAFSMKERMSLFVDIGASLTRLNILKETDPDVDAGAAVRKYAAAFAANASDRKPRNARSAKPRLVHSDDDPA